MEELTVKLLQPVVPLAIGSPSASTSRDMPFPPTHTIWSLYQPGSTSWNQPPLSPSPECFPAIDMPSLSSSTDFDHDATSVASRSTGTGVASDGVHPLALSATAIAAKTDPAIPHRFPIPLVNPLAIPNKLAQ